MGNKPRTMLFASLIGEAISGFTADYAVATENNRKKWEITIDAKKDNEIFKNVVLGRRGYVL